MKKKLKIVSTVILVIFGIILIDTIQAIIFKKSPIISFKDTIKDNDSWVKRGILLNTYYCTKEQDIITVYWKLKTSKFTCPVE